jgi:hypothetical protein
VSFIFTNTMMLMKTFFPTGIRSRREISSEHLCFSGSWKSHRWNPETQIGNGKPNCLERERDGEGYRQDGISLLQQTSGLSTFSRMLQLFMICSHRLTLTSDNIKRVITLTSDNKHGVSLFKEKPLIVTPLVQTRSNNNNQVMIYRLFFW